MYTVDTRTNRILRTDYSEVPNRTVVEPDRMAEAIGPAPDENSSEQYWAVYEVRKQYYLGNTWRARALAFDICVSMLPAPGARDVRPRQGMRGPLAARKKVHGNTAGDQPATLYEKYDSSGNFLKHGVSQNPSKRYTQKELDGGYLIRKQIGPRKEMLKIERDLVERRPGHQNNEPWAGKRLGE